MPDLCGPGTLQRQDPLCQHRWRELAAQRTLWLLGLGLGALQGHCGWTGWSCWAEANSGKIKWESLHGYTDQTKLFPNPMQRTKQKSALTWIYWLFCVFSEGKEGKVAQGQQHLPVKQVPLLHPTRKLKLVREILISFCHFVPLPALLSWLLSIICK